MRRITTAYPVIGLYTVILLTVAIYWPGLPGPLILDDVSNLKPLLDLERGHIGWLTVTTSNESGHLGRPLSMLSFVLNTLASGFDTWQFKFTNLMIHVLTGTLVFWLSGRLFLQLRAQSAWHYALLVAALWLTAPLYVSTVLYTIQRMAQLSTLFMLAGLLAYTVGRQLADSRPRVAFLLVLSTFTLWTGLASFSKENGALLPLLALVVELGFFRLGGSTVVKRYLLALFAVFLLLPGIIVVAWLVRHPEFVTSAYRYREFTLEERLLTESRILFSYLRALLIPNGPALGLFHDDYPISSGLMSPWYTLPIIASWVSMQIWFLVSKDARVRVFLFGLVFFLSAHLLESSVYPLELYFEHRNYLPGFGIYFAVAVAIQTLLRKSRRHVSVFACVAVLPLLFAVATSQRSLNWESWNLLVRANALQHPDSARIHTELASLEMNAGNMAQAVAHLDRVLQIHPSQESGVIVHTYIGSCLTGSPARPDGWLDRTEYRPSTYAVTAVNLLADLIERGHCNASTAVAATRTVAAWLSAEAQHGEIPHEWKLRFNLARLFYSTGRPQAALTQLSKARAISGGRLEPGLLKVKLEIHSGRVADARRTVDSMLGEDSGDRPDLSRLVAEYNTIVTSLGKNTLDP